MADGFDFECPACQALPGAKCHVLIGGTRGMEMSQGYHPERHCAFLEARVAGVERERDNALDLVSKREAELEECLAEFVALEAAVSDIAGEVEELQKLFAVWPPSWLRSVWSVLVWGPR